jgi:hypothetical protein
MKDRGVLLSRRLWAVALVGLLGVILTHALASQSASVVVREPLVPRGGRGPLVAVPLAEQQGPARDPLYTVTLVSRAPDRLAAHEELWLFLDRPQTGPGIRRARLVTAGTTCRFESGSPAVQTEAGNRAERALVLRRSAECRSATPALSGALRLEVEVDGAGVPGLWAYRPREINSERGPILVEHVDPDAGPEALSVRGFFVDYPPTAPRVTLLNAMWRLSGRPAWIWWAVAGALAVAALGCLLFPTLPVASDRAPRAGRVLLSAVASALLALGLASLHAVLTPPLFGPDEPYHLLGFAQLNHDERLAEDTVVWMGQTHVLRIRYRPAERFRTVDVGTSFVADDDQLKPTEVEMRSATLARLWHGLGPLLHGQDAPHMLLALRLVNSLVFAAAVGLAAALSAACAGVPYPQWLSFPFFFVPSLPFFAMHVSETAVLCSAYIVLAASIAVLFLDGPRAHWAGVPLGLATALMLAGGRSPWPLAAIVVAALAARLVLGPRETAGSRPRLVFWLGTAAGLGVYGFLLNDAYVQMVKNWSQFVPRAVRPLAEVQVGAPALVFLFVAVAVVDAGLERWRARVAAALAPRLRVATRRMAAMLSAGVVVSLVGSLFLRYPHLPLEPRHAMSVGERVTAVLATMATAFRLRDPNFLLATTFWVGFGWLDAIPGPILQALLILLAAASTVGLLNALSRPPQLRRLFWLLALAGGGLLALVLYTVVTQGLPMALQGRYLIGWYLVFLTVAGCWVTGLEPGAGEPAEAGGLRRVRPLLLAIAGGIHVYCLTFILRRYF